MTHRVRDYALDLLNEGVPHGTVPALLRRRFGSTKEVREVAAEVRASAPRLGLLDRGGLGGGREEGRGMVSANPSCDMGGALDRLVALVQQVLVEEGEPLRNAPWAGRANRLAGHCYVASEAVYHLLGGAATGLKPVNLKHEGSPHWYLATASGRVIDPTESQFVCPVPHGSGRGKSFLTKQPSKRARVLMGLVLGRPGGAAVVERARREVVAMTRRHRNPIRPSDAPCWPTLPEIGPPVARHPFPFPCVPGRGNKAKPLPLGFEGRDVLVHLNINSGCLSVLDAHSENLLGLVSNLRLRDVTTLVRTAGWRKVVSNKGKNVHSYVRGTLVSYNEDPATLPSPGSEWRPISYRPHADYPACYYYTDSSRPAGFEFDIFERADELVMYSIPKSGAPEVGIPVSLVRQARHSNGDQDLRELERAWRTNTTRRAVDYDGMLRWFGAMRRLGQEREAIDAFVRAFRDLSFGSTPDGDFWLFIARLASEAVRDMPTGHLEVMIAQGVYPGAPTEVRYAGRDYVGRWIALRRNRNFVYEGTVEFETGTKRRIKRILLELPPETMYWWRTLGGRVGHPG